MTDVIDVFGFGSLPPGRGSPIAGFPNAFPSPLISPVPGQSDTGGIFGGIIDLLGGLVGGRLPALPQLPPAPGGTPPLLPGRIPPAALVPGAMGACLPNPCCSGQHLNKTRGCDGAPPGTKCVSNRRMNALNPKALRRAIRRAKGFERFVKSNRKSLKSLARI